MEQKLSESERYLWHFIEAHILGIPNYSIVELSERVNVSTATIIRAMERKSYKGFTSFKHHLKGKENQNINFSVSERVSRGIRATILKNEEEVTRTINIVEIGNIKDAIQRIKASRRIITFARGFSELIVQEMMVKFQLAGKYCELHTDPEIIKNISKELSERDMALFISLNGEAQELVVAGKNCYNLEIGTILLTASKHSSLMKYIEIPFVGFESEGSFFPDYEVHSRLPLSTLAGILLGTYTLRAATQALLNNKESAGRKSLRTFAPRSKTDKRREQNQLLRKQAEILRKLKSNFWKFFLIFRS